MEAADARLSGGDPVQRLGAAFAFAHLAPDPLPMLARAAILDAIAADEIESSFRGLPWDTAYAVDRSKLEACLDVAMTTDLDLPILANPQNPSRPIQTDELQPGQRVLHRTFGLGTIVEVAPASLVRSLIVLTVRFDDQGLKKLGLQPPP